MPEIFNDPNMWLALGALTILEIILGIDNIIFLSLVVRKLPISQQRKARQLGLFFAMLMRLVLLASLMWVTQLNHIVFNVISHPVSIRDMILFIGGVFLVWKGCKEIIDILNVKKGKEIKKPLNFTFAIVQIMILDIVFSLDSVITAIGIADEIMVMSTAVILAVVVMVKIAEPIANFIERHSSVKILAMTLIILIGFTLILEGLRINIPKEYIYFSMFFSLATEIVQIKNKRR
ncbi:TerC family protein [Serratia ureilytica]|uniref:TerC family protein n=1 Tax=Serratia ureilytica TaxID=300181 RepID=UPI001C114B0D|nr:TerC family protein [Serratia ureilytica]MBU5412447.1 TerC family protein [Serratia ureilytica]